MSAARLSADVELWTATPEQEVRFVVDHVTGADQVRRAMTVAGDGHHVVVAKLTESADGSSWWAELVAPEESSIVSVRTSESGEIERIVWMRSVAIPLTAALESAAGPASAPSVPDGRRSCERYFEALRSSRFADAASRFSADAVYSHPPYVAGGERVVWRGRAAIAHGLTHVRGASPVAQVITGYAQAGDRAFVRGHVENVPNPGSFLAFAELAADGAIRRWAAWYTTTRIPGT